MKRLIVWALLVVFLVYGCDGPVIPPSTESPEVQIPETTVPPTTEPPLIYVGVPSLEPTEIAHPYHETLESTGFVHVLGMNNLGYGHDSLSDVMYCYTGDSSVIELPLMNMTLTLPEGWLDRVYVLQSVSLNGIGSVKILNRSLMEAYEGFQLRFDTDSIETNTIVWWDYIVSIEQTHGDSVSEWTDAEWDRCVGNNDVFFYRYHIVDANSMKENSNFLVRQELIETIGQDGYDELVGNLVVDKQMVMNMITIHETKDHSEKVEAAFAVAAGFIENRDKVQYLRSDIDLMTGTTASLTEEARKQIQLDVNVFPSYTQTAKDYGREIVTDTMDYTLEKTVYLSRVLMQETGYPSEFRVRVELVFADVQEQYARLVVHEEIHFLGRDSWGESITYRFGRLNEVFLYCHEGQWLIFDVTTDDGFDAKYKYSDFSSEAAIAAYEANK